jgi:hypothetical protein
MTLPTQFFRPFIKLFTLTGLLISSASFVLAENLVVYPASGGFSAEQTFTATVPTVPGSDDSIIFEAPPRQPEIGSPLFLDPEIWYRKLDGVFSWTLPFDVTALAIEVSDDPMNVPQDNPGAIVKPPDEAFVVSAENIKDGIQYISINFENQVGWGAVLNRPLKIDTTAPLPFLVNVTPGSSADFFPLLNFNANDETSGIDFYQMTIADKEPIKVTPDEAAIGYLLRELEDGTYTVFVVAHDMAGNTRQSSAAVLITSGWTKPIEVEDAGSIYDFFTGANILIFFLSLMVALLVIYVWYEHKVLHAKEEKLRRETREIQDQMEKIFSALRDEIYDQINHITKRKRMSAKEKEAVESLTQALEVSEILIEKEISDVKSILR